VALVLAVFFGILMLVFVPYWALVLRQEHQEERVVRKRLTVQRVGNLGGGGLLNQLQGGPPPAAPATPAAPSGPQVPQSK